MTVSALHQAPDSAPPLYERFLAETKAAVAAKGLSWDIPLDADGKPLAGMDWDLRRLNGSHGRHACGTVGFAVEDDIRQLALEAGWPAAKLPVGQVLSAAAQDFVKALIARHCLAGRTADSTQVLAKAARRLLSATVRAPWELSREDFDAVLALKVWSEKAQRDFKVVGRLVDEHLLSLGCPVEPSISGRSRPTLLENLSDRVAGEKLPEKEALFELTRIVFQEQPTAFNDAVLFAALKLVILTGLRITEVLTLPADCLVWDEHADVITGQSAAAAGGVGRSLRLRYYAEKQRGGAPDLLVEKHQHVPARFEQLVASTVAEIAEATRPLREALEAQSEQSYVQESSDIRSFKTSTGQVVGTWHRLLLTLGEVAPYPLATPLQADAVISTPHAPRVYNALGRTPGSGSLSFFKKYGATAEARKFSVKPHSLRHLMNTELFRLNVPDTVITHQFGRATVAQSYEYDHRSLAEKLKFVQLPPAAARAMPLGSTQELVAKMVVSGVAATSHIGQSFKRIQAEQGDDAAFAYLAANSDGFHVTPYGFCTNSFSVNPCARHLKCFDNCKHFAASGLAEHRVSLSELRSKLVAMRSAAEAKPATTVGRKNQISHAERLLTGVSAALAAQPNHSVFEAGVDHASRTKDIFK